MKTFKQALAATTALTLTINFAYADENEAYLSQSGSTGGNAAGINQSGAVGALAGRSTKSMQQNGSSNSLKITQSGTGNRIANAFRDNNGTQVEYGELLQSGASNAITLTQSGEGNSANEIIQRSGTSGNTLTLTQSGSRNAIEKISQESTSANNEDQPGNTATITMSGSDNEVALVYQKSQTQVGNYALTSTVGNTATIDIRGTGNGGGDFGTSFAAVTTANEFRQVGRENTMTVSISGGTNQVGVKQEGGGNSVGTLSINGSGNQLGVRQYGTGNDLDFKTLNGSDNEIGISQIGLDQRATVNVSGANSARNSFRILQDGDAMNETTVTITGSDNGSTGSGTLSGPAATIGVTLTSGLIEQWGDDNSVELFISGNDNAFQISQARTTGTGNEISSRMTGDGHALAIVQGGSSNFAQTMQSGTANSAAIRQ